VGRVAVGATLDDWAQLVVTQPESLASNGGLDPGEKNGIATIEGDLNGAIPLCFGACSLGSPKNRGTDWYRDCL